MTREKAIELLKSIQLSDDQEMAHVAADNVLCALLTTLGCEDVVAEYHLIDKWFA